MTERLESLIAGERHRQHRLLRRAALFAMLVATSSVLLLGLSGWFITAAAGAGLAGVAAAQAFNYMLPSAGIRLLAIVRTGARYGERLASHEAAFSALARIRPALFRALAAAPGGRALAVTTGEATARLVQDVDAIEARFVRLPAPWSVAAALASGVALTALGGWWAALSTALCLAMLLIATHLLTRRLAAPGRQVQQAAGALKEEIAGLCEAAPELRCYALEAWAADRAQVRSRSLADAQHAQARMLGWLELFQATAIALAAILAALLSHAAGGPIAALAALAAAMTVDGASPLLRSFAQRSAVEEATARIDAILQGATPRRPEQEMAVAPTIDLILHRPHRLHPGERVLIGGRSGSGKTTLIEGMLGLRLLESERVRIAGKDAAAIPDAVRRRCFGWSPQDAALLSGTVRDNLLLARPDADEAALWAALHDAALDQRVRALPQGLDSWVGENGARLSGGERRRLSLARAYLADAPWLLLDEPSEGLDAATEALVRSRLANRLARTGQGLILTSHSPALAALADRVIPIEPPAPCSLPGHDALPLAS
ncbi:ATP-binding cassette domain-containing protein [uncultured Sphingomonas sp.]|uniref:amino acid ABC transporter ATP-binding/permease protein n=1 Tax=uncultured Sphingomonas sp. TaxID=158754 RepID=UPI0025E18705|nr:ATP-binding cassette domain-containing protein [uncultured Sphingomonas sp.]